MTLKEIKLGTVFGTAADQAAKPNDDTGLSKSQWRLQGALFLCEDQP